MGRETHELIIFDILAHCLPACSLCFEEGVSSFSMYLGFLPETLLNVTVNIKKAHALRGVYFPGGGMNNLGLSACLLDKEMKSFKGRIHNILRPTNTLRQ